MASIFDGLDLTDPCAVWPVLYAAHLKLLAGEASVSVEYEDFKAQFQPASIAALERMITRLKVECAAKSGGKRRRFAMRGGY